MEAAAIAAKLPFSGAHFPEQGTARCRAPVCALPDEMRYGQITERLEQRSRRTDRSRSAD